ncbi:hypothetical protein [Dyadobacter sp. CY312]|uniref:hypothetical protein n=1 Tax=Dyadobacter sp. CY312 TaxID=2907303 RepID=UPI001F2CF9D1|nr:hypothetical protein [Dyadobacter sp. CY312]MCE7041087.1 hypothetical protein [Dyadobacter sp. CY312]
MKIAQIGLIVLLACMLSACTEPEEETNRPFIKTISFAGIPNENVILDKAKSRITIQLPAILKGGLKPVMELSKGAQVVHGLTQENTIDLTSLCVCNYDNERITLRLDNKEAQSVYEIVVIPEGLLGAQNTNEQFTFLRNGDRTELSLPVENLYTNPHVDMLFFTNLETGKEEMISADAACLNHCNSLDHNRMIFSLSSPIEKYLKAGTYKIAFNNIKFPQHLVVTD